MSVHPKLNQFRAVGARYRKPAQPKPVLTAAMVMLNNHPLYQAFVGWLRGAQPTKRQARAFLSEHPQYQLARAA